jgi:hypothetical protein
MASVTLRRVTILEVIQVGMGRVIWLQTATVFWLGGGTISLSCWMYMELMMLDWNIYSRATGVWPHEIVMAIEKLKNPNPQVLIKLQQNLLKQVVGQFTLRPIHLLIPFGKRICVYRGRSRLLEVIKQTEAYHFCQLRKLQNFIQHTSVKVNLICRGNYWGSSVWIST